MTTPQIINVYPANTAKGIPVGDRIKITFNQEMDLDSINSGTIVLTGPDDAPIFGPIDNTPLDVPGFDDEDILSSPYFPGYVKCTIAFLKLDASGGVLSDDIQDTTGDGGLWYTQAIITPEKPLKPNADYTCLVLGDNSSSTDSGVKSRSVFDTVFSGSGSGRLNFYGGYSGSESRSYTLEITSGGTCGTAEYLWWNDNDPLAAYPGITTTGSRELEDGIYVVCDPDGSFTAGDKFTVVVLPAYELAQNYSWSFSTGGATIITPPSDSSASGIAYDTALEPLKIVSILPSNMSSNIPIEELTEIVITFNKDIDPSTITDDSIMLWSEPVNGIFSGNPIEYTGNIAKVLSVNGKTVTIQLS